MSEDPASSGAAGRRPGVPDMLAGGTFVALGLAFALGGSRYGIGSTLAMGPGFVPVVLGVILTVLGAFITAAAFRGGDPHDGEAADERGPVPWARGGMLVAGIVFFGATIEGIEVGTAARYPVGSEVTVALPPESCWAYAASADDARAMTPH